MNVVRYEVEDGVCTLTLDRPEALNAFSPELMSDVAAGFLRATDDEAVKVVIVTGEGRAFSAGADLKAMGNRPAEPPKYDFATMLNAIIDCPKPTIVAANGLGVGIGMTIFGIVDFAYVAESSRFRTPFSSLGLTAEAGSTYTFSRLVGHQKAAWILLSGQWFSGADMVDMGLAMEVVPDDELMDAARGKATSLAKLPLASLMKTKELMLEPHREAIKAAFKRENQALAELAGGPANKEALAAFMEKREADFTGL